MLQADMTRFLPVAYPLPGRPLNGSLIRTTKSSNCYLNPIQPLLQFRLFLLQVGPNIHLKALHYPPRIVINDR